MPIRPENNLRSRTNIAYELPSTVKSLNDGWLSVCQTAAAASGLLAVVEVVLLTFMKNPVHYTHPHTRAARQALLAFSYCALVFSCSATISSLVLTDEFGELPVRASRKSDPIKQGLFDSSSASLLEVYGARRSWRWVMWHWLFSLTAGVACLVTQILIYVWIEEPLSVQITVSCVAGFGVLPLLHFIPMAVSPSSRRSSVVRSSIIAAATSSQTVGSMAMV
ncbi:hypothetical protein EDB92DRAFT_1222750 [Lactarius akahatsu]|uniref:Uncharacterized protein n=1 Tax=Lactarius akahatsu TaxID=416441 RepID=A0AAD4LAR2_9AGAM|nr:hypothetical protein EDB92DRAFT_1222750 [Lactarius akahatsu]